MRLHLVDGTYELFRAHFSKRPSFTDKSGRDRKATLGVLSSMLALLTDPEEQVTHIAIAFDNPIRSFRNRLFEGYKTEEGMPAELIEQMAPVEEAARALGLVVWSMDEWEADDALATAAARFGGQVDQVRILTPDKDLAQCLSESKVVQVDRMRKRVIDESALLEARGIAPASIPDWLALVGDTADGIPGLPGFGEKTAATLLRAFRHLEHIPKRACDWGVTVRGAEGLCSTLESRRDDAHLYRTLATLVRDVPLSESLDDLRWRGVSPDFDRYCKEMGISESLAARARQASQASQSRQS